MFSADIIHDLVKDATGDEEKAQNAYTDWVNNLVSAGRPANSVISLDAITLGSVFADIFNNMMANNINRG